MYLRRAVDFTISGNQFIDPNNSGVIDHLKSMDSPEGHRIMKSTLAVVNYNATYQGYKPGDLIMVCAPTKVGKSTLMVQEGAAIAQQGFKVAHMWFGDMSSFDGWCKYVSTMKQASVVNVIENHKSYVERCQKEFANLRMASHPGLSKTLAEVFGEANSLRKTFDFDLLILDYDANIISTSDEMYAAGGTMYAMLKGYAQANNIAIIIGSQAKPSYALTEILDQGAANESSRKQHAVDFMVNIGRNPKVPTLGSVHIPLMRRGKSLVTSRIKFEYETSRITEISSSEYQKIKQDYMDSVDDDGDCGGDTTFSF